MKISVSYLKSNQEKKATILRLLKTSCDYIHVDLMDGIFAGEKNYELDDVICLLESLTKPLDIHLMIQNPAVEIRKLSNIHPSFLTVPVELDGVKSYIKQIKSCGICCGLAINPDTPISNIIPYLNDIDLVLVMSVNPGRGGQTFIDSTILKLKELCDLKNKYSASFFISVDGGINDKTIQLVKDFVDIAVSGSFVCMSDAFESQIQKLKQ